MDGATFFIAAAFFLFGIEAALNGLAAWRRRRAIARIRAMFIAEGRLLEARRRHG